MSAFNDFNEVIGKTWAAVLSLVVLMLFAALLSGTVLWAVWDSLHTVFPTANADLGIPKELAWWDAIKFSFLCSTVFRAFGGSSKNNSKRKSIDSPLDSLERDIRSESRFQRKMREMMEKANKEQNR